MSQENLKIAVLIIVIIGVLGDLIVLYLKNRK